VRKSADADFLRKVIGFAAQRLMDLEVGSLTGAGYGEKSSERLPSACFPTMLRIAGTLAGSAQRNG